ncbi:hypothetical protein QJS10_CPB19g00048 [Acorus calamus]|uniref:Uncharacterized protein n=1 Tax=Acorus calamus TaxID=4465 RepID=A0AAV9CHE2_ACOCL|nr:hypothetical protein QJS10_CPB19g00048 [Acorus calamus]
MPKRAGKIMPKVEGIMPRAEEMVIREKGEIQCLHIRLVITKVRGGMLVRIGGMFRNPLMVLVLMEAETTGKELVQLIMQTRDKEDLDITEAMGKEWVLVIVMAMGKEQALVTMEDMVREQILAIVEAMNREQNLVMVEAICKELALGMGKGLACKMNRGIILLLDKLGQTRDGTELPSNT